eukprot:GHUV01027351.1.p2 GENE.GHUV01027351.1~~GHUV01027351.1.p2  ORF type:complete len:201 (-),score=29.03 GHUV01027351.1:60-662(-)
MAQGSLLLAHLSCARLQCISCLVTTQRVWAVLYHSCGDHPKWLSVHLKWSGVAVYSAHLAEHQPPCGGSEPMSTDSGAVVLVQVARHRAYTIQTCAYCRASATWSAPLYWRINHLHWDQAICAAFLSTLQSISHLVAGQSLWAVLAIFCGLVLVGTTFISHTVGAMVILPIVQAVGQQMPGGDHSKLLVMGAALMCSGKQ